MNLQILFLFAVWYLHLSHALSTPRIQTRCWAKTLVDTQLKPESCIMALREILHRYPQPSYAFSKTPYHSPGTIALPLVQSYKDCTIMLDIFYVTSARETMSRIVTVADRIIEDCVGTRQRNGGSRAVGTSGLWMDILPTRTMRSGRIAISYSNSTAIS